MGMSTHVVGFVAPDAEYLKKVKAWRACTEAGVQPPPELVKLFDGNEPQEAGMEVNLGRAVSPWSGNAAQGVEVDVTQLPKGVRIVRFYNSW
jgi:hypothetical protein